MIKKIISLMLSLLMVFSSLSGALNVLALESADGIKLSVNFDGENAENLIAICQAIQHMSPIDSFATPYPSAMPGYDSDIIMASGSFTMGSSIELSCDAPVRAPFTTFMQGGTTFDASRAAVLLSAQKVADVRNK